nr:immunoglobulin light chain junction region [Macaca mulatta]MOW74961.1 immunoglobulin light chain junction region [Macaca mulatta]
CQQHKTYPYSF